MKSFMRRYWLILLFVLIKLIVHLIFPNPRFWELQRDEYLYLADGRHLAWGYMAIPPVTGFLAYCINLLGGSYFIVKLVPAIIGAATLFIVGAITIELEGGLFAQLLACLAYLLGAYLRLNMLFQPNSVEVLCYTLSAYFLIRYIHSQKGKYIIYTGIVIGIGMLNKYSILLLAAGILIGLLLTQHRKLFKRKNLYLSILLAFLIFLPNFLWQLSRHFPVAFHMRELEKQQLQYVSPVQFIIDQFTMNFPVMFIWISGLIYLLFNKTGRRYILIGWIYLAVIILLLILHGKNYYSLGTYPALMAAGGVYLEKLTKRKALKYFLRPVFIIVPAFFFLLVVPLVLPIFPPQKMATFCSRFKNFGVLRWEDGKNHSLPQDYADMIGWKSMTEKVAKAYDSLTPEEQQHTFLFCDNYGEAGAISYYGKQYHLPEVYSDNASFLYWIPDSVHIDNLLLVTGDHNEFEYPFAKDFKEVYIADSITTRYCRERGTFIYIFKGANKAFNDFFHRKIVKDDARDHL